MAKIACCYNCAFAFLDKEHTLECYEAGLLNWPACANHPESYGRMQRTPPRGMCPNYRPRPEKPEGDVKQIPIGDGYYTYVDAADYEWLSRWKWHMQGGYAVRYEKRKLIFMHRQIRQPPPGRIVDHKNRNRLDNTRDNLRICTHGENTQNAGKIQGALSRFKGVSYRKERDKYFAQICHNGEPFYLGLFAKETDAARAYDHKAVELFGEFARVNFPEEWPPERRAQVYVKRDAAQKEKGRGEKARSKSKKAKSKKTGSGRRRTKDGGRRTAQRKRTQTATARKPKRKTNGAKRAKPSRRKTHDAKRKARTEGPD
jgi:hypothetical protein